MMIQKWKWSWQKASGSVHALTSARKKIVEHRYIQAVLAKQWTVVMVLMAFLLGRAVILDQFTPFALAFFAVTYYLRKDLSYVVALAIMIGSFTASHGNGAMVVAQLILFYMMQKGFERYDRVEVTYVPVMTFVSALLVHLMWSMFSTGLSWYVLMIAGVEAVLCFILSLIFIQAIPVITLKRKNYHLKTEEMICLVILLASVMTGLAGWIVQGISLEHVVSRYFVLLFALVGGAPLGASVGVVTGLILSLANVHAIQQISLLAFGGLLAGLFKEGKRVAVAFGLLLGSSILSMYVGERTDIFLSSYESLAAIALFFLTPRRLVDAIAKYIPGTPENLQSHTDYARRVRDVIAGRVDQFSEVFRKLSQSFHHYGGEPEEQKEKEVNHFMNTIAEKTCATCWKKNRCWDGQFYETYKYMTDMMTAVESDGGIEKYQIPAEWKQHCVKTEMVLDEMKREYQLYKHNLHWKKQIQESRQLVAEQLIGVSRVMEDLSREIQREGQEMFLQEEQIRHALEDLGLSIRNIDIISLDEGNVQIEVVHQFNSGMQECRKLIAPLLTNIIGEHIAVKQETPLGDGTFMTEFSSAKEYEIETGMAGAAKGGELLSGDSFSTLELGTGKFAVAISDGMGNGERAHMESRTALSILHQLLKSGMDERLAIKSVNSILLLRSPDEMFATIDMALIDQYNASTTFMKIGSTPSFIKRGDEVITVTANNLPIGILQDIEVDFIHMQLEPGDQLILMTDGLFDAPGHAVNKEMWMKRMIQELETDDPQEIADCLLERVVRHHEGEIRDDMTVVVARIEAYKPEWSTFSWPGLSHVERPRTAS